MIPITSTSLGQIALVNGSNEAAPVVVRIGEAVADARRVSIDSLDALASYFDVDAVECFFESATTSTKIRTAPLHPNSASLRPTPIGQLLRSRCGTRRRRRGDLDTKFRFRVEVLELEPDDTFLILVGESTTNGCTYYAIDGVRDVGGRNEGNGNEGCGNGGNGNNGK